MPFLLRVIAGNDIRQVQHGIEPGRSDATFLIILTGILPGGHPLQIFVLDQAVIPLHTGSQRKLRCESLSESGIQSERHTLGDYLREIAAIGVHQAHVDTGLHEPVVPNPVRQHPIAH